MKTEFVRARSEDRDEMIDFTNYVFSHSGSSTDFPSLLPKLYNTEYFMDHIHYLVREDGRIKAVVGAYTLELEINCLKSPLPGRGIGMVSVHPYCRSKGYMNALMKIAMDDMKKDGIVFSCLGGQRQRYSYFGFYPTGSVFSFSCNSDNIRHTLGSDWKSSLTLKKAEAGDTAILDEIQKMHESKSIRIHRSREKLFHTASTWKHDLYIVSEEGSAAGYFIYNGHDYISEIVLKDYSKLIEVAGLLLQKGSHDLSVSAGPHEREKIKALSGFAENYEQSHSCHFAVLDYARFLDALVKHKNSLEKIRTGSFVIHIEDGATGYNARVRLFADGNGVYAQETNEEAQLKLNGSEAGAFLFSPLAAQINPVIRENDFLRDMLPLPLFIESADNV